MRAWIGLAFLVGCGADSGTPWVADFTPPDVQAGYTRFVTPVVKDIAPGANVEWCQWVAEPGDTARDVMDMVGYQSATGHHAILYATTATNFHVGESHECTTEDMLHISFLGAVGGEGLGGNASALPAGLNFRLPPGQALMILVPLDVWVTANFKKTQLTDMRAGQTVRIRIDAYPGRDFAGHVDSIQAGSGTAFSLLPAENATGNYVKVVQRVPVKIVFDEAPNVALGPGMSVVPRVGVR